MLFWVDFGFISVQKQECDGSDEEDVKVPESVWSNIEKVPQIYLRDGLDNDH